MKKLLRQPELKKAVEAARLGKAYETSKVDKPVEAARLKEAAATEVATSSVKIFKMFSLTFFISSPLLILITISKKTHFKILRIFPLICFSHFS